MDNTNFDRNLDTNVEENNFKKDDLIFTKNIFSLFLGVFLHIFRKKCS